MVQLVCLFAGQREKLHFSPSPDIIRAKFLRPSDVAARLLPSQNQMCAAVYRQRHLVKATEVTAGLAESNGSLLPGLWSDSLHVTCGISSGPNAR